MKKVMSKIVFFFLLMFPLVVSAYGIENFYINGVVAENGDMVIEEYFEVNGEYNGYERIIYYRNDNLIFN